VDDTSWLEATSIEEASALLQTLARHGVSGACVVSGGRYYVRFPSRLRTPDLARELAAVQKRSRAETGPDTALSAELRTELRRLGTHPRRELRRLEHEVANGENPATPAILIAGLAVSLWTLVALVASTAVLVAHLVV
jgi:hypothetical protein